MMAVILKNLQVHKGNRNYMKVLDPPLHIIALAIVTLREDGIAPARWPLARVIT